MANLLHNLPWGLLIVLAVFMAIAPLGHTPHLFEKLQMLFNGTLKKPIDIFDLVLHSFPLVLVALKGYYAINGS